jgi:hypothetical protein
MVSYNAGWNGSWLWNHVSVLCCAHRKEPWPVGPFCVCLPHFAQCAESCGVLFVRVLPACVIPFVACVWPFTCPVGAPVFHVYSMQKFMNQAACLASLYVLRIFRRFPAVCGASDMVFVTFVTFAECTICLSDIRMAASVAV